MPAPYFLVTNKLRDGTVTAEDTITNFGFANALDGRTSTQVGFASGASRTVTIDMGSSTFFHFWAVAGHNLEGATLTLEGSSNGTTYITRRIITIGAGVTTDEFSSFSNRYIRITVSGHSSDGYISDLFLGDAIELPYGMPVGFVSPEMADEDLVETQMTGYGAIVGITVTERPKIIQVPLDDYEESWFASNWIELREGLKQYPGYFLWAEGAQAFFGSPKRRIDKPRYTTKNRMSVKLDLEGFTE